MTIAMYKTDRGYFYAVEIGQPQDTVNFGEGESPADAVRDLRGTQYQSADFSCSAPANEELAEYFESVDSGDCIVDCLPHELEQAEQVSE